MSLVRSVVHGDDAAPPWHSDTLTTAARQLRQQGIGSLPGDSVGRFVAAAPEARPRSGRAPAAPEHDGR